MKIFHSRHRWIALAAVAAVAMLTLSNVYGQRADSGAMFHGRPALAGAQAGAGPMAGPPQGGIGVQTREEAIAGRGGEVVPQRRDDNVVPRDRDDGVVRRDRDDGVIPRGRDGEVVRRDRDSGIAKDERSAAKTSKRAVKRLRDQAKHGVGTPGS